MPDLIAQGTEAQQRWRRTLPEGETIVLGRLGGVWAVPWDRQVSHRHARLLWNGSALEVTRLPDARNPVFLSRHRGRAMHDRARRTFRHRANHLHAGRSASERDGRCARAGPAAVVQLAISQTGPFPQSRPPHRGPQPSARRDFGRGGRQRIVRPAGQHVVGRRAPGRRRRRRGGRRLGAGDGGRGACGVSAGDGRRGTGAMRPRGGGDKRSSLPSPFGRGAGGEGREESESPNPPPPAPRPPPPFVLHWDQRLAITGDFQPSQGLILESLRQRQSVLHVWHGVESTSPESYTASDAFDWAFCTPVLGKACRGWGLYVAGRFNVERSGLTPSTDPTDLREDVKFTELVAAMLSSLRANAAARTPPRHAQPVLLARRARHARRRRPRGRAFAARDRNLGPLLRSARLFARVRAPGRRSARAAATCEYGPGRYDPAYPRGGRRGRRFPGRCRDGLLGLAPAAKRRRPSHLPRRPRYANRVPSHRLSSGHRSGHRPRGRRQDRHHRSA